MQVLFFNSRSIPKCKLLTVILIALASLLLWYFYNTSDRYNDTGKLGMGGHHPIHHNRVAGHNRGNLVNDELESKESEEADDYVDKDGEINRDRDTDEEADTYRDADEDRDTFRVKDEDRDTFRDKDKDRDTFRDKDEARDTFRDKDEDRDTFRDKDEDRDTEDGDTYGDENRGRDTFRDKDEARDTFRDKDEDRDTFRDKDEDRDAEDGDSYGDENRGRDTFRDKDEEETTGDTWGDKENDEVDGGNKIDDRFNEKDNQDNNGVINPAENVFPDDYHADDNGLTDDMDNTPLHRIDNEDVIAVPPNESDYNKNDIIKNAWFANQDNNNANNDIGNVINNFNAVPHIDRDNVIDIPTNPADESDQNNRIVNSDNLFQNLEDIRGNNFNQPKLIKLSENNNYDNNNPLVGKPNEAGFDKLEQYNVDNSKDEVESIQNHNIVHNAETLQHLRLSAGKNADNQILGPQGEYKIQGFANKDDTDQHETEHDFEDNKYAINQQNVNKFPQPDSDDTKNDRDDGVAVSGGDDSGQHNRGVTQRSIGEYSSPIPQNKEAIQQQVQQLQGQLEAQQNVHKNLSKLLQALVGPQGKYAVQGDIQAGQEKIQPNKDNDKLDLRQNILKALNLGNPVQNTDNNNENLQTNRQANSNIRNEDIRSDNNQPIQQGYYKIENAANNQYNKQPVDNKSTLHETIHEQLIQALNLTAQQVADMKNRQQAQHQQSSLVRDAIKSNAALQKVEKTMEIMGEEEKRKGLLFADDPHFKPMAFIKEPEVVIELDMKEAEQILAEEKQSSPAIPGGTYDNIKDTYDVRQFKTLPQYKNPCWYELNNTGKQLRCLPYFFLAGIPSCGENLLLDTLRTHPQVVPPLHDSPNWWNYRRLQGDGLASYIAHYDYVAHALQRGVSRYSNGTTIHRHLTYDASPNLLLPFLFWHVYGKDMDKPENVHLFTPYQIHKLLPDAKFIILVCDPLERLYAWYYTNYTAHSTDLSGTQTSPQDFDNRVENAIEWLFNCTEEHNTSHICHFGQLVPSLHTVDPFITELQTGFYGYILKHWRENFTPHTNLRLVKTRDLLTDRLAVMRDIGAFLGLDPWSAEAERLIELQQENDIQLGRDPADVLRSKPDMLPDTRHKLQSLYKYSDQYLGAVAGKPRFFHNA